MQSDKECIYSTQQMGARIAERRKQLGFTQERIAELSGVSPQFFSSIETGSKICALRIWRAFAVRCM